MLRAAAKATVVSPLRARDRLRGLHMIEPRRPALGAAAVAREGDRLPGRRLPGAASCRYEQRAVVDGDCRSAAIAAASVLAKVTRDRYMRSAAERHPRLGLRDQRRLLDSRAPGGDQGATASRRCTGCRSSRSPTSSSRSASRPSRCFRARTRASRTRTRPRRGRARQPPAPVERDADRVEAQLGRPRPAAARSASHCRAMRRTWPRLRRPDRGQRPDGRRVRAHAGLDLAEHQAARVRGDQVELAVPRAEVALEHRVAARLEVAGGERLAERAEPLRWSTLMPPKLGRAARRVGDVV